MVQWMLREKFVPSKDEGLTRTSLQTVFGKSPPQQLKQAMQTARNLRTAHEQNELRKHPKDRKPFAILLIKLRRLSQC